MLFISLVCTHCVHSVHCPEASVLHGDSTVTAQCRIHDVLY